MNKLNQIYNDLQSTLKDEKGATMVEYALMVALIAIVVMAAVEPVGTAAATMFGNIATAL